MAIFCQIWSHCVGISAKAIILSWPYLGRGILRHNCNHDKYLGYWHLFLMWHSTCINLKQMLYSVWPDWTIYSTYGNFSKPVATIILPKSPTFLYYFCKGFKNFHFSSEIIFWKLLWTFENFLLVTLVVLVTVIERGKIHTATHLKNSPKLRSNCTKGFKPIRLVNLGECIQGVKHSKQN